MALREMITRGERIAGAGRGTRRMAIVEAVTCKAVAMDGECYEDGTRADLRERVWEADYNPSHKYPRPVTENDFLRIDSQARTEQNFPLPGMVPMAQGNSAPGLNA